MKIREGLFNAFILYPAYFVATLGVLMLSFLLAGALTHNYFIAVGSSIVVTFLFNEFVINRRYRRAQKLFYQRRLEWLYRKIEKACIKYNLSVPNPDNIEVLRTEIELLKRTRDTDELEIAYLKVSLKEWLPLKDVINNHYDVVLKRPELFPVDLTNPPKVKREKKHRQKVALQD